MYADSFYVTQPTRCGTKEGLVFLCLSRMSPPPPQERRTFLAQLSCLLNWNNNMSLNFTDHVDYRACPAQISILRVSPVLSLQFLAERLVLRRHQILDWGGGGGGIVKLDYFLFTFSCVTDILMAIPHKILRSSVSILVQLCWTAVLKKVHTIRYTGADHVFD